MTLSPLQQISETLNSIERQLSALSTQIEAIAYPQPPMPSEGVDIVPLRQRDPKYAANRYGGYNSTLTIGSSGCLITSFANLINSIDKSKVVTPVDVQDALAKNDGYARDEYGHLVNVVFAKLGEAFPIVKFSAIIRTPSSSNVTAALLAKVDDSLSKGVPVICEVDNSPSLGLQQHWIAITKRLNNDYQIADPWWDDKDSEGHASLSTLLSHYPQNPGVAKTIQSAIEGLVFFEKT